MGYAQFAANNASAWQLTCVVNGLVARTGAIWTPGTMVWCKSETLSLDEPLFLKAVERTASANGQRTSLTLLPRESIVLQVGK